MNGRRTSLADSVAISTAVLEAHIPGLRRFAHALLHGDRSGPTILSRIRSNARSQAGACAGSKVTCAAGFTPFFITASSASGIVEGGGASATR
jgi:hypothetical protein